MSTPRRVAVAGLLLLALVWACGDEPSSFLTPATTFAHYRQALAAGDAVDLWACLAAGYRREVHDDDVRALTDFLNSASGQSHALQVADLEIVSEVEINDRVAYLQFDAATVAEGQAPFYYFLREPEGWKITTHLDSLFRAELEVAVENGQLQLPR